MSTISGSREWNLKLCAVRGQFYLSWFKMVRPKFFRHFGRALRVKRFLTVCKHSILSLLFKEQQKGHFADTVPSPNTFMNAVQTIYKPSPTPSKVSLSRAGVSPPYEQGMGPPESQILVKSCTAVQNKITARISAFLPIEPQWICCLSSCFLPPSLSGNCCSLPGCRHII